MRKDRILPFPLECHSDNNAARQWVNSQKMSQSSGGQKCKCPHQSSEYRNREKDPTLCLGMAFQKITDGGGKPSGKTDNQRIHDQVERLPANQNRLSAAEACKLLVFKFAWIKFHAATIAVKKRGPDNVLSQIS